MREIKFRIWDRLDNRMEKFIIELSLKDGEKEKEIHLYPEDTLMQYTGLKDKNGVEIYEDDIVEFDNGREWYRYKIVFLDGGFKVVRLQERIKIVMLLEVPCRNDDIKVIGNIYENPELLEEIKNYNEIEEYKREAREQDLQDQLHEHRMKTDFEYFYEYIIKKPYFDEPILEILCDKCDWDFNNLQDRIKSKQ